MAGSSWLGKLYWHGFFLANREAIKNNHFMGHDIRYSELLFLRALSNDSRKLFDVRQSKEFGFENSTHFSEMAAALIEDLYIRFDKDEVQLLVSKLRGELSPDHHAPSRLNRFGWDNPREAIQNVLSGHGSLETLCITYRGLRRIEELRDILRSERILEPHGILLSMQYFRRDLEDAIKSGSDVSVSVIYVDMDNFKRINTEFGQSAGDVVMKSYLEVTRNSLGLFGTGYRGVGDEVAAILAGQGHERAIEFAEKIRNGVESLECEYKGIKLPQVSASIGVATTPPAARTIDIEDLAQSRKQIAKDNGKNQVISH